MAGDLGLVRLKLVPSGPAGRVRVLGVLELNDRNGQAIEEHDKEFPGLVETVETGPQLLAAIQGAIANDNDEKRAARRERVRGESWDGSFGEMIAMLKERQSGH